VSTVKNITVIIPGRYKVLDDEKFINKSMVGNGQVW